MSDQKPVDNNEISVFFLWNHFWKAPNFCCITSLSIALFQLINAEFQTKLYFKRKSNLILAFRPIIFIPNWYRKGQIHKRYFFNFWPLLTFLSVPDFLSKIESFMCPKMLILLKNFIKSPKYWDSSFLKMPKKSKKAGDQLLCNVNH